MKTLFLQEGTRIVFSLIAFAIVFIIGVFITRWIFGIDKIITALEKQNDYQLTQVRLLKRMLLNQGNSHEEIDDIIDNGNKKK